MKPTAQQVWEATINEPKFASSMPEGSKKREAIRPFIIGSVEVLEGQFEDPVTLKAIANAKVKVLRYCVDNDLGGVMSEVMGIGGADILNGMFERLITMLKPILENVTSFLEDNGITEEQHMISPQIGMNAENQQKWRDGALTIGELLLAQPLVILQNDG